ncbi:bifunctional diguanylate cyclase/phosphodiesterase [Bradyrhizobium betae]|uniref:Bifunctional diguanylate cyclase/phosphodiesterase n=1 Tax=Bradyrhizobium betae TaxID=244734 RepID=A0A4Q1UYJ3_9BRAD|nr:bifunctional diguanylate cyclase/phosphodiesterase [Bradyrhizobium betae]
MLEAWRKLARSPGSSVTILGLLFSAVIVALPLVDFVTRYREALASAQTDAANLAAILAEHAAVTFEDIDRVLLEAEAIRKESLSGKYASPGAANAALRQLARRSSILVAVGWTDASGEVVAHSYDHTPARSNISEMSHFIAHRDNVASGLFVAPPYRSAVNGKWFSAASRRLSNPDGSFAGIVTAPLDQSYLLKIYRTLDLGGDGSVVLLHRNGRVLARVPEEKDILGKSVAGGPLFTRYLPLAEAGSYELTSPIDGIARVAGYKAVSGLPLVMVVTYTRSHVLQPWYRHLYLFGPLAAAIVVIILVGTWLLRRQTSTLAETNARFDAALSNMPHGLSMFDADEKLLIANSRYREIYELTEAQVKRGTPLRDIVRGYNTAEGDLDLEEFLEGAKRRAQRIVTLADGRIIAILRTPMQNGGWVATHQDITEKRRDETLLAEHAAELKLINTRFDVAISNMSQGLCLFDVDKNLVISNSRYQQMYDLPDELVRPGTPLQRILQHYADRGEADQNLTVNQHLQRMPNQRQQDYQLKNSRQILIQRKPLPDGGWVATHEDVTEQRRGEQMLAEKAAELEAINLRFDAALNNMSQGLCLFDADQRIVVSNARYGEIYHLGSDQITPGTSLAQILDYRREQGTHFADVAPDVYRKQNVKQLSEIRELADGRVVAIARHMMPGGGWLTTHEDITDRARNEKRIAFLAQHDLLTGLANRAVFSEKLDEAARRLERHGSTFTVLMLDLDRFKAVNDTLGHAAGDQLLVEVARRLQSSLRDTDVLARLGGDEFAIIQENEKNQSEGAIGLALRIIDLIEQPFDLGGNRVSVGTSIGIALAPEHGSDAEALLKKADIALYATKSAGRNDYRIFQSDMTESADTKKSMEVELREAMARDEFELHYQPVIDARTRAISGVEAFVRWHHPSKGVLAPEQFMGTAESAGLLLPLGEWILRQACLDAAAWPAHVRIAVNVSAAQLHKGNFFDVVLCALVETGLSPERLELEVPSGAVLDGNPAAQLLAMRQLKNLGVSIVLDDCGMGYSAASFLQGFPFDKIKIDRSIVQGCTTRRDCAAAVASAIALANGLDIATVAKGVESREQFESLRATGVDFAQGYLFGRPVPCSDVDFDMTISAAQHVA